MNSKILTYIYFIGYVLIFFPLFVVFFVPKSSLNIIFCLIFAVAIPLFLFLQNKNKFLKFFYKIFKLKIYKNYLLFIFFIILNTFLHFILGYNKEAWYINLFGFINLFITLIFLFLYPLWSLYMKIRIKTIIKLFYIMIFVTMLIGFLQLIAENLNISFIKHIIHFLSNGRYIYDDVIYDTFRINSVYKEPSTLAAFIYVILPFVFNFTFSKYSIFSCKILNLFFKCTLLPLTIYIVFLTASPIYILFTIIELFILSFVKFKRYIFNKHLIVFFVIFIMLAIPIIQFIGNSSLKNNNVTSRISTIINSGFKLSNILFTEMSLATRISTAFIYVKIFQENPIFGVGINNANSYADRIFTKLSIPITGELVYQYNMRNCIALNKSTFWNLLAETGIVGISLYIYFFITLVKILTKIRSFYKGIEYCFISSLFYSLIAIGTFSTFYFESFDKLHFWLLYGFVLFFYYRLKYYKI